MGNSPGGIVIKYHFTISCSALIVRDILLLWEITFGDFPLFPREKGIEEDV